MGLNAQATADISPIGIYYILESEAAVIEPFPVGAKNPRYPGAVAW